MGGFGLPMNPFGGTFMPAHKMAGCPFSEYSIFWWGIPVGMNGVQVTF